MCVVDSSRLPPPKKDFCLVISAWYPMSRNTVSERYIFSVIQDTQKVFLLVAVDVKVREIGISYRHNALTKCHCKSRPHFLTHFNGEVDFSPLCEQRTIWKHLTSNVLGNFWHTQIIEKCSTFMQNSKGKKLLIMEIELGAFWHQFHSVSFELPWYH